MEVPEWLNGGKEIALFLLAIYGAVLSTFNWLQARAKDKRNLRLSLTTAVPTYGDRLGPCFARIEVVNSGHRPVTISSLYIRLESGARLVDMSATGMPGVQNASLPVALSDGQFAAVFMSYRDIAEALIRTGRQGATKLIPACDDTLGTTYQGEPWVFNPVEQGNL